MGSGSRVTEVRVNNWDELNSELFRESWNRRIGRFRGPYLYRGMLDCTWDLQTSLMRLGGSYADLERPALRNFRKYAHTEAAAGQSEWHWLAVAQHYGLPTRLLDWTYSPHVAAHFATEDVSQFHVDGVVWVVDFIGIHQRLLPRELLQILKRHYAVAFSGAMLDEYATDLEKLDEQTAQSGHPCVLFVEPPSLNQRIVNQAAFLSLMSPAIARLDHLLDEQCADLYRKIIIPASVKLEIRDKLDMMNINERMIYPGLEGISKWLKRLYSPLNLIAMTYGSGAQPRTAVGVIDDVRDGVLAVQVFFTDGERASRSIQSKEKSAWWDLDTGDKVAVKWRVGPSPCAEAAVAYARER
jgi:hypothetical protein